MDFKQGLTMGLLASFTLGHAVAGEDPRTLVNLPPPMQEHMLQNMREHLLALNAILAALEKGETQEAGRIAEARLGVNAQTSHGAAQMAPLMPEGMRAMGGTMHRAASRFVTIAQDAELEENGERKVFGALREITDGCNGCHQAYRIR